MNISQNTPKIRFVTIASSYFSELSFVAIDFAVDKLIGTKLYVRNFKIKWPV